MEDTKPRLLIKIIHFCQSWAGQGKICSGINRRFFFLTLFFLSNPTSISPSIFHSVTATAYIRQRERERARARASPRLSLISPKSFCLFLKADLSAVHFSGAINWDWKSHLSRGKGWLPDCHLFLDSTTMGVCRCDWIHPLCVLLGI